MMGDGAILHAEGLRVFRSDGKGACELWQKAWESLGHTESGILLGMAKWHGEGGVEKDVDAAIEIFRTAGRKRCKAGASAAQFLGSA